MNIHGYATTDGTEAFKDQFENDCAEDHFQLSNDLHHSSIGLGTYLGDASDEDDNSYVNSIKLAVQSGVNVIDTAINYRYQRSERNVGTALKQLLRGDGPVERSQVIVSTKGGYIPFDGEPPENPRDYVVEQYIEPGIISPGDLVNGSHCLTPDYLDHQLQQSRRNLGLETLDCYYLHNPEIQRTERDDESFYDLIERAFQAMETAVERNQIRSYGLATWNGFRVPPDHEECLDLSEIIRRAREAGGDNHHFQVIQCPYNLAMTEILGTPTQTIGDKRVALLEAAYEHGLTVMTSASLMQGSLTDQLPESLRETMDSLEADAQRALQFTRSAPGVTTALVGMRDPDHVRENLTLRNHPRVPDREYMEQFFERTNTE